MAKIPLRVGVRSHDHKGEFLQWQVNGHSDGSDVESVRIHVAQHYRTETGHDADSVLVLIPGGKK